MLLLDDGDAIVAVIPVCGLREQALELQQRRHRYPWLAQVHDRASGGIEHPRRHDGDRAGGDLDVDDRSARALLAVEAADLAAVQRMPPILDDDFLSDMGRMFGESPSGAVMRTAVLCELGPVTDGASHRREARQRRCRFT